MMRPGLLVAGVALAGLGLAAFLGTSMLDLSFGGDDLAVFAFIAVVLAGIPALLAALPTKQAAIVAAVIAAIGGVWGWQIMSLPGDGAIGGYLLLALIVVFLVFAAAIIGLRAILIKKPSE